MMRFIKGIAVLAVLISFSPALSRAQDEPVSFQVFYDQLGDQGTWIQVENYGYCFQPHVEDPDWAPYTVGHWVDTDAGWVWVSREPWGWATYHYGRWANIEGTGWVWVPGNRWAPAWVSWRYGGGYCGWAPLPPESFVSGEYFGGSGFRIRVGFAIGENCDDTFHMGAGYYHFVPQGYMGERDYRSHYVSRGNNVTIINRTTNITNITVNKTGVSSFNGVRAGGPSLSQINASSQTPVRHVNLVAAARVGTGHLQGDSLTVYAPRIAPGTQQSARPPRVTQTVMKPAFNRGNDAAKPLQVTRRQQTPSSQGPQAVRQEPVNATAQAGAVNAPASRPAVTNLRLPQSSVPAGKLPEREDPSVKKDKIPDHAATPYRPVDPSVPPVRQATVPERKQDSVRPASPAPPSAPRQAPAQNRAPAPSHPEQQKGSDRPAGGSGDGGKDRDRN